MILSSGEVTWLSVVIHKTHSTTSILSKHTFPPCPPPPTLLLAVCKALVLLLDQIAFINEILPSCHLLVPEYRIKNLMRNTRFKKMRY